MNDQIRDETHTGLRHTAALHNPWVITGLLFLVTGALGIPLIWLSRAFSRTTKWILTVAVSVYTVFLLWGFWRIMAWCYGRIVNAL
ncbi:MAG: hypothetical protein FJ276_11255 [Planctomycetes bacterium]|nr:hypothetical protein [Planctomycetota bacterium]